eukprot:7630068-Alexandrium_andersonii.AAC.1
MAALAPATEAEGAHASATHTARQFRTGACAVPVLRHHTGPRWHERSARSFVRLSPRNLLQWPARA